MKKMKVLVCGTRFGYIYLSGFKGENLPFTLAGILAQESKRSKQYAKDFSVPLYTDLSQIPSDIDIACVVVRSTIVGGEGTDLAIALMKKEINVIQEHLVHFDDTQKCLRAANENNVHYHLNTLHAHNEPVRRFCSYIQQVRSKQKLLFIHATCGVQVTCSVLDIIGTAIGKLRPFTFTAPIEQDKTLLDLCKVSHFPYTVAQGALGAIPLTLAIQNHYDSADPDNNAYILHRICIGFESGNLMLLNTCGPVIWPEQFHVTDTFINPNNLPFNEVLDEVCPPGPPSALSFDGRAAPSKHTAVSEIWSGAARHALKTMCAAIATQSSTHTKAQYYLDLTQAWRDLMRKVGSPSLVPYPPPPPPWLDPEEYFVST